MGEAVDETPTDKPTLAAILDQLDETAMNELVATAEAATMGETPEAPPAAEGEPAVEGDEVPAGDETESADEAMVEGDDTGTEEEAEPTEADIEDVASQGFEQMQSWAEQAYEALGAQVDSLNATLKAAQAAAEEGADPDAVEALVEQADATYEAAGEQLDAVMAGVKAEDAHAAATAALQLERSGRILTKLVEQAAAHAETTGTPEAGFYDEPAVKLWAERTGPKMGPIGG
jgi:hypothetical protein